jgi:hypothetical protein
MSNTTLFLLSKDIKNLDDVRNEILSIQTKEEVKYLSLEENIKISDTDRYFISKWQIYDCYQEDICSIKLPNENKINFLIREAYIESSRQKRNMFDAKGFILPKSERTIFEHVKAIFFEKNNCVYLILFTTDPCVIRKVKQKLLNEEVYINEINEDYRVNSDIFYWLFYKYMKKDGWITDQFEIESIFGFLGNIADEHHTIKEVSEAAPDLLVTKTFISKFHPIRSLSVILKTRDYSLDFIINDANQCIIELSSILPDDKYEIDMSVAIIIYAFIIPELIKIFKNDKSWTEIAKKGFAKSVGEDVIKEIAKFHNIDLKTL